jgi:hypothetical protein
MNLFDTTDFLTRGHCGKWTTFLQSSYVISDGIIAFSYLIIPYFLVKVWRRKKTVANSWILLCFSAFIFSNGMVHVTNVAVFWWAPYRFYIVIYFITAILSAVTLCLLPRIVRNNIRLLSRQEYHDLVNNLQVEMNKREIAITEKNNIIESLESQIRMLERIKSRGGWLREQEDVLMNLKKMLRNGVLNGN